MADSKLLGCILSEEYSEETDIQMADAGIQVEFRVAFSHFRGRWQQLKNSGVTGIFLWPKYQKFSPTVPHFQREGTCVARGAHKALQHSYYASLFSRVAFGEPKEIAWEPIYPGSRLYPGKGRLTGQGSNGSWAAQWLSGVNGIGGFCTRGIYGSANISHNNEKWAVENSYRGDRLPQELLDACQLHTCATHRVKTNDEIADAIASDFGVFRCWDTLFGSRNSDGIATAADSGAHCQAVVGVFVCHDGEDGFVELQSWGPNNPKGPNVLKFKGGEIELPPGYYGVRARDYVAAQRRSKWWEAFAVSVRAGQEFRD